MRFVPTSPVEAALAPLAVIALSLTPVDVFGCRNRGLLALAVVMLSAVAALAATVAGAGARAAGREAADPRWMLTTAVLLLPILLVLGPLG